MANELILYGSVGASFWDEEYFTPTQVRAQLKDMDGGPLTVRLNSGGGFATDGQTIYTMLRDYPGRVDVVVDGAAASAASLIAMAGDTITVRLGAFMLIHDPAQWLIDGRGTAEEHRSLAQQLDTMGDSYARIYAKRAGLTQAEAREIMKADTLYDGEGAVEAGFADAHDADTRAAVAASFDYRIYKNAPADLVAGSEKLGETPGLEAVMAIFAGSPRTTPKRKPKETTMADTPAKTEADVTATAQTPAPVMTAPKPDATIAERTRVRRIMEAVSMASMKPDMATTMIEEGISFEMAFERIRDAQIEAETAKPDASLQRRAPVATVQRDARDKFVEGAGKALMAKVGLKDGERNEFSSLSLSEMAREAIMQAGERPAFDDRRKMIGHAFTMAGAQHTTSDFASILANVASKAALVGWDEAEETFDRWTRAGTLTDFKATKRVGTGLFSALDEVDEGGEYKYGTIGDREEEIVLATYGKLVSISRQAIMNDDLNMLGMVPRKAGRAARRTIGNLVYAVLTGNPNMADGVALFHADHNNLAGSGAVPSVATLSAGKTAMMTQKEAAGGASLNIRPRHIIAPVALETTISQLLNSSVDPTATKGQASNPVQNMAELITDARLDDASATAWYMASDPNAFDTIEVAYLDGVQAPYLEEKTGWSVDGVELKVRIDAGVKALDYRTMYKNAGA